jgi:hypothetical protein
VGDAQPGSRPPFRSAALSSGDARATERETGGVLPPRAADGVCGEANRDNNYILDHVARLRDIPVNVVHGRYDRVCHLYQAEALVRACAAPATTRSTFT